MSGSVPWRPFPSDGHGQSSSLSNSNNATDPAVAAATAMLEAASLRTNPSGVTASASSLASSFGAPAARLNSDLAPSAKAWSPPTASTATAGAAAGSDGNKPHMLGRSISAGAATVSASGLSNKPPVREFIPGKGLRAINESQTQQVQQHQQQQQQVNEQSYQVPSQQQQHQHHQHQSMGYLSHRHSTAEIEAMNHGFATISEPDLIEEARLRSRGVEPPPPRRTNESDMMPDNLRAYFAQQTKLCMDALPPDDPRLKEVPRQFHSILPLDDEANVRRGTAGSTGYPTTLYKVCSSRDGHVYALRRIDNVRSSSQDACAQALQAWSQVKQANIVPLRQAFMQQRALFLVHDYVPGAATLHEFMTQRQGRLLPEATLWSICTQLLTGIRAVHDAGMACRGVLPQRILISGRHRVRLSCAGLTHSIETVVNKSAVDLQHEDLVGLARVVLLLGCMTSHALTDMQKSVEFLRGRYSPELAKLIVLPFQERCNIYDLLAQASRGLLNEVDSLYAHSDALEEHLGKQFESERVSRLLMKMSLINERPQVGGKLTADAWSETGDRYLIKLFRDYVFHQTDEHGRPWMDLGHIIDCLNKLDVGSDERVLLNSRNGKSFFVVTYQDVRRCIEEAFQELVMS